MDGSRTLWPPPREAESAGAPWQPPSEVALVLSSNNPALLPAADRLRRSLPPFGIRPTVAEAAPSGSDLRSPTIRLEVRPDGELHTESYRLRLDRDGALLTAPGAPGLFHAAGTLTQWIRAHRSAPGSSTDPVPPLRVEDWPDLAVRGFLLDISRDRVPTMESLYQLVDLLAEWKLNQLQLYMEHTFAYRGHETVWRDASPMTADEIRTLDAYCSQRMIELVPCQNSLGHFHRWLTHEPYRELAECPEGVEHPFSDRIEPFSLCPTDPRVLALLEDLYDQLTPQFSSRQLNVGLDEAFDLGRGRSAQLPKAGTDPERLYLDFLRRLHRLLTARRMRMQFWADMVAGKPHLLDRLPADVMPLEWGYEPDHPFGERAAALSKTGLDFCLCPGTGSWNSMAGRLPDALENIRCAVHAGRAHGAHGLLLTDWGDWGHLQPPPVSWPPLAAAAGLAWSASLDAAPPLPLLEEILAAHGPDGLDRARARALVALGGVYRAAAAPRTNGTVLFQLLRHAHRPLEGTRARGLTAQGLRAATEGIEEALTQLGATAESTGSELVDAELRWAGAMLRLACDLGLARLESNGQRSLADLPSAVRRPLASRLGELVEEHRTLWNRRSRPGGLNDSTARLERIATQLR